MARFSPFDEGRMTNRPEIERSPTGTAILTYFTLPNSNHEGKGSPIEKLVCRAKVSPQRAKMPGPAYGRVVVISASRASDGVGAARSRG
jgi:hypothetical protein